MPAKHVTYQRGGHTQVVFDTPAMRDRMEAAGYKPADNNNDDVEDAAVGDMSVAELREAVTAAGMDPSGMKKGELIEALTGDDDD